MHATSRPRPRQRVVENRKTVACLTPLNGGFLITLGDSEIYVGHVDHPQQAIPELHAFYERYEKMRRIHQEQLRWLEADESAFEERKRTGHATNQPTASLEELMALEDRRHQLERTERYLDDCQHYRPESLRPKQPN